MADNWHLTLCMCVLTTSPYMYNHSLQWLQVQQSISGTVLIFVGLDLYLIISVYLGINEAIDIAMKQSHFSVLPKTRIFQLSIPIRSIHLPGFSP